jgi:hypothetical protein
VSLIFVQSRPWVSFLLFLEHQTSHAVCFNARGLLYECIFDGLLFSSSYRPTGKLVYHHVVTQPTFSLHFWIITLAILPAMMLGYYWWAHLRCPLNFLSLFRSIGSLLHIGRQSTSLRSANTSNRSAAKSICFFLFGQTWMLFDLSMAQRLRHDLSKVTAPAPRSGACETWVPLGPHRLGSRPSRQVGSAYQKTHRPVSGPNRPS